MKEKVNKQGLVAQVIIDDEKMEEIKNDILEQVEYNIKEIKSEATKEFAEKLKEYFPSIAGAIDFTAQEVLKG